MSESVLQQAPEAPKKPLPKKKTAKSKKTVKRVILFTVLAVVLAGLAYLMYRLFFVTEEVPPTTAFATYASIESKIYGSGSTRARNSEDIITIAKGSVKDIYVSVGDKVAAGAPLFSMDADTLESDLAAAEKTLDALTQQREDLNKSIAALTLSAPFSGKVLDVSVKHGDMVSEGQTVATYIDDSKMRLKLYFSYAYQGEIKAGMPAQVSISSIMAAVNATVEDVQMIRKITTEGAVLFEVTLVMNNPGTLTKDMVATASIPDASGEPMMPADTGLLEYNRETNVLSGASGEIALLNMNAYREYASGSTLMRLENTAYGEQLDALAGQIADAEAQIAGIEAQFESLEKTAPIDGTVTSLMISPGQKVDAGLTVMNIADLTNMVIEAQVSEIDISKVAVGMNITINQDTYDGQKQSVGVIESIGMQGNNEYGVSYFPVIVSVDNSDGTMMPGMSIWFELTAIQKDYCLTVPPQAIQNMPDGSMCVFLKAEQAPENAIDVSQWPDIVPEGFYAVPVEVGISNENAVEIVSGIDEGAEVYCEGITNPDGMYDGYDSPAKLG